MGGRAGGVCRRASFIGGLFNDLSSLTTQEALSVLLAMARGASVGSDMAKKIHQRDVLKLPR